MNKVYSVAKTYNMLNYFDSRNSIHQEEPIIEVLFDSLDKAKEYLLQQEEKYQNEGWEETELTEDFYQSYPIEKDWAVYFYRQGSRYRDSELIYQIKEWTLNEIKN